MTKLHLAEHLEQLDGSDLSCPRGHAVAVHDGHDGLSSLRKICKARPFAKLACVINTDLVAIIHVSFSRQLSRVVHELINSSILGHRLRKSSAVCCESEASVENCVLSFSNPLVLSAVVLY